MPLTLLRTRRSVGLGRFNIRRGSNMAVHHASSDEWIDVGPLDDALKTTPTTALFKSSHLEVSRTVPRAGKKTPLS